MTNIDNNTMYTLINTCPIGMVMFDDDLNIVDINTFGAGLLEYLPEELLDTNLNDYILHSKISDDSWAVMDENSHARVFGVTKSGRHINMCIKIKGLSEGMAYGIFHDPTEYSTGDTLTDTLNRDQFFVALNRMQSDYSLLFIDLNKFKAVNDTMGHITGDLVLKTVAKRIKGIIRETDLFCRYGGDEFVIVVDGNHNTSAIVSEKIKALVEEPIHIREHTVEISCSIGVALSNEADSVDELINIADQRMYTEKA